VEKGGISMLRSIGFNRISIGIQDFNEQVQIAVNRKQSVANTAAVIAEARQHAFKSINVDLIYGLPHQTRESFSETLDTIIDLDPDRIAMYNYAHLPHRFPPQRRIRSEDLPDATQKLGILGDAIDKLTGAGFEYIGMDHFSKPQDSLAIAQHRGSLHRNFQGYSSHAQCDAIGMGVSAISNIAENFSQNTTDLETYHQQLQQNQLPIVRGYHSNKDDLLRREIIQGLICNFYLDLRGIERRWGISFTSYFESEYREMKQMQDDGLIKLSDSEIVVREAGRFLVRNICMTFDRFNQKNQKEKLFSRTV
jgi:oxygen-independent coproporphyrinogen-3 oxidase